MSNDECLEGLSSSKDESNNEMDEERLAKKRRQLVKKVYNTGARRVP